MKHWQVEIQAGVADLVLDTGSPGNRLSPQTFEDLLDVLDTLTTQGLRGLMLRSAQADFTQGFDLALMLDTMGTGEESLDAIFEVCNRALTALYQFPGLTLSFIQGSCVGGGLLLALATDFRSAAPEAKFGFPEVRQSLVVNLGLQRVYRLLGEARTKELVLLGRPVTARTMQQWGAVQWVEDNREMSGRQTHFRHMVHQLPPLAVQANKHLIHALSQMSFEDSLQLENKLQKNVMASEDFQEAISSFLQKRKPNFQAK